LIANNILAESSKTQRIERLTERAIAQIAHIWRGQMIRTILEDLRSTAQKCKATAGDCSDEELSDYLQEVSVILKTIASVLEEFDQ
jgi:hypothetical protein